MEKTIASFFCENGISFHVADSSSKDSSFARMIEESMGLAKQIPFQLWSPCEAPSSKQLSGELLDQEYKSTEQLVALILAIAKKFGATGHLWILGHHLFDYMHTVQGGAAAETPLCRGWDSCMSIVQGPSQVRGAKSLRESIRWYKSHHYDLQVLLWS